MTKKFISVQHWVDKTTEKSVTKFAEANDGVSKVGAPYGKIDFDKYTIVDGLYNIGTFKNFTISIEDSDTPVPTTAKIKLGS